MSWLLIGSVVFAAATLQGIVGFGFGMLSMSVLPLFMTIQQAVPIVAVFTLVLNVYLVTQLRAHLDRRKVLPLVLGGLIGAPFGVFALRTIDTAILQVALGVIIVAYCLLALAGGRLARARLPGRWAVPFGAVGGLLQAGLNTGGPPVIIYTSLTGWDKDAIKATTVTFFLCMTVPQTIGFLASGMLSPEALFVNGALMPALLGGVWLGTRLYTRVDAIRFRQGVLSVLMVMGVVFLLR